MKATSPTGFFAHQQDQELVGGVTDSIKGDSPPALAVLVTSNRASPGTSKGFPPHQSALLGVVAQYLLETFRGGQGFGDGHGYGRSRRLVEVEAEDAAQAEGSWMWEQKTLRVF